MSDRIKDRLEKLSRCLDIPYEEIKCYGNQITIECLSLSACNRWRPILAKFSRIRGCVEDVKQKKDYDESWKKYKKIWRIYSAI